MSLNSLKIATSGYLKRGTKAALVIAVAGYLNFSGTPPIPPVPTPSQSGGGASSSKQHHVKSWQNDPDAVKKAEQDKKDEIERIKLDDNLVFNIIKIWTERCQT